VDFPSKSEIKKYIIFEEKTGRLYNIDKMLQVENDN